jgi:SAM-dependent methyltransferase
METDQIATHTTTGTERARWGPLAAALLAYHEGQREQTLIVRTDLETVEEWPVRLFFRDVDEFPPLEREALELCGKRVVDVGAGAGPHTLALLERGHDVLAVESLPEIANLLQARGFPRVTVCPLGELPAGQADTVLMLMNGLGLAGTLAGLVPLLESARRLLAPGGRIIADSTDPRQWIEAEEAVDELVLQDGRFGGEVQFQLEYDGTRGEPFPFLYVDPDTLCDHGLRAGLLLEEVRPFTDGTYLAIMAAEDDGAVGMTEDG